MDQPQGRGFPFPSMTKQGREETQACREAEMVPLHPHFLKPLSQFLTLDPSHHLCQPQVPRDANP
jgi:hypothetical protein